MTNDEFIAARVKAARFPVDLHDAVAAVCPINGICIGAPENRATWSIHFAADATDEQKQAALDLIGSFVQPD